MIFNKNSNGTVEVKGILGFIYKTINFDNLSPFINLAKEDLIKEILGDTLYTAVENIYLNSSYDATQNTFETNIVKNVQNVIALGAYMFFVKGNDVQHTNDGRQISVGTNLKPAFSHQIQADDTNLLNIYDKYIELLLRFLNKNLNNALLITWKNSDQYKVVYNSLINTADEFNTYFDIENSYKLFLKLSPIKKRIENKVIKSIIGEVLYDKFMSYILTGAALTDPEVDILEKCKMPIVMLTVAQACILLPAKILPDRIIMLYNNSGREAGSQSSVNLTLNDRHSLSGSLTKVAQNDINDLTIAVQKYLSVQNGTVFESPEMYLPGMYSQKNGCNDFGFRNQGSINDNGDDRDKCVSFN